MSDRKTSGTVVFRSFSHIKGVNNNYWTYCLAWVWSMEKQKSILKSGMKIMNPVNAY